MTNLVEFVNNNLAAGSSGRLGSSAIFQDVEDLIQSVENFALNKELSQEAIRTRAQISRYGREFANRLGKIVTDPRLLDGMHERLSLLESQEGSRTVVLMSAHQPNLFAYSGVMKKIALLSYLSSQLVGRQQNSSHGLEEVVCFFGFADQDFAHNKWVRSAEIDSPLRKEGVVRLNVRVDKKDGYLPTNRIATPPKSTLDEWRDLLKNWISENSSIARNYVRAKGLPITKDIQGVAGQNLDEFWDLVERVQEQSRNLAEFNSFLLASVCVQFWGMPLVFANFSDCFRLFGSQYKSFIEHHQVIRAIIEAKEGELREAKVDSGLSEDYSEVSPLWMKCDCGSKIKFDMSAERAFGKCLRCSKEIELTTRELADAAYNSPNSFEPRSIFMPIAFSEGFGMSCYVGGIGGLGYLLHSRTIAEHFGIKFPPTPFWYSKDEYTSIQALAAEQEIMRIKQNYHLSDNVQKEKETQANLIFRQLKELAENNKIPRSSTRERDLQFLERVSSTKRRENSCMIDYAVNISIRSCFGQWVSFLESDGNLNKPVKMKSAFE